MKRNIDLTQKQDFDNISNSFLEMISRSLQLRIHGNKYLPWRANIRHINSDNDLKDSETSYDNVLITGNKTKRVQARFYRSICKNICDCCGRQLDYIPWKRKFGLCEKCDKSKPDNIVWRSEINFKQNTRKICWK